MNAEGTPMALALAAAGEAAARGEVPVGAVLVDARGEVLAAAGNRVETDRDPTAHAEMLVLRAAAARSAVPRLLECDLWVTLEPCAMCAAAIGLARLRRLYFAAYDPKGGAVEHGPQLFDQPTTHHRPEIYGGIEERRAGDLLRTFFRERRSPAQTRETAAATQPSNASAVSMTYGCSAARPPTRSHSRPITETIC